MLNKCNKNVTFQCKDIIADALLNLGPSDSDVGNILEDVLDIEDCSWYEWDMDEEVEQQAKVSDHPDPMRPKVNKISAKLTNLRSCELTDFMAAHDLQEWKELITNLENLACKCYSWKSHSDISKLKLKLKLKKLY